MKTSRWPPATDRRSKDSVEIKAREGKGGREGKVHRGKENENANGAFSVLAVPTEDGRKREDELEQRL